MCGVGERDNYVDKRRFSSNRSCLFRRIMVSGLGCRYPMEDDQRSRWEVFSLSVVAEPTVRVSIIFSLFQDFRACRLGDFYAFRYHPLS